MSGDAGNLIGNQTAFVSPITMNGKTSLNGSETVFIGDLVFNQSVGGRNNMRGGGVTGGVVLNGPASFAVVNANTTSLNWKSIGTGANLLLIGCTGLAAAQSFTSSAGGAIGLFNHFGGDAHLVMNDSLGTFTLDHTRFGSLSFDITDGTTGTFNLMECSFNHFDDPTLPKEIMHS